MNVEQSSGAEREIPYPVVQEARQLSSYARVPQPLLRRKAKLARAL